MKLNAICVMKNEVDIVGDTLKHALQFCDNIYLLDNGSDDGTWELICGMAKNQSRLHIIGQTHEVFKNQLRNRIYNLLHHQFSDDDWWYILDADELLHTNPKNLLQTATAKGYSSMDVWQAQFYYTDQDLKDRALEDLQLPIPERRFYYQINWRELRFFKNSQQKNWSEAESGRVPSWCNRHYYRAPVCRHYAERTPEQIEKRRKIRINNPYSFFHVKNKQPADWLKKASQCRYYQPGAAMQVGWFDAAGFYWRQAGYWLGWRVKQLRQLVGLKPSGLNT